MLSFILLLQFRFCVVAAAALAAVVPMNGRSGADAVTTDSVAETFVSAALAPDAICRSCFYVHHSSGVVHILYNASRVGG